MTVSRDNLDIQRAMQALTQASSHEALQAVFLCGGEDIPGYIAYRGRPVAELRISSEAWPPRSQTAEEEEIPENCLGVFQPERTGGQTFFPAEEFVRAFDPSEYETGPDGTLHLSFSE